MNLKKINIINYRSIKDQTLYFERNFQILVGINEAGKSNVLKAVSLLNDDTEIAKNDIRDPAHEEDAVKYSVVRFIFTLESKEIKEVFESVSKVVLANPPYSGLISLGEKSYSLGEFCNLKSEFPYVANIITQKRYFSYYTTLKSPAKVLPEWRKVKTNSSHPFKIGDASRNLNEFSIVNVSQFKGIPLDLTEDLTVADLNTLVGKQVITIAENLLPQCIVWRYTEDNLLPGRISLSKFIAEPNSCIPLKNMFHLSGYDASKALKEAQDKTNGITNVLRKVSKNTTSHMKKVWPEWKKLNVTITQNGDFIEAGIEDEFNVYSLERRSDGFKRFFTFLLMISAQNKTEHIYDNIIVIDEPDIGIHPTGVQYLREELKKIGMNNLVLISTHSIFMIDKERIDRHLIVEKNKEITEFRKVEFSNITDEEVIYKALGYSLYELLKPKNIIFEGWRDKVCFELILNSKYQKDLLAKKDLPKLGLLHSLGVKDVPRVAQTCDNFARDYIIVTDSDKPAREKQRLHEGSGKWLRYDEFENIEAVTTEDFISNDLINASIKQVLLRNNIDAELLIPQGCKKDKLAFIEKKIENLKIESIDVRQVMNQIKEEISENLKVSHINESYLHVCKTLLKELFSE